MGKKIGERSKLNGSLWRGKSAEEIINNIAVYFNKQACSVQIVRN